MKQTTVHQALGALKAITLLAVALVGPFLAYGHGIGEVEAAVARLCHSGAPFKTAAGEQVVCLNRAGVGALIDRYEALKAQKGQHL